MLVAGKRYEWCIYANIPDAPKKFLRNGIFTGQYTLNGKAILMCKNGDSWQVNPENIKEYKMSKKK